MYFKKHYPNILAIIRLSHLDQAANLALVPLALREEESMNVDAAEVMDVSLVEEKVKDMTVVEAESEDEVTITIHYIAHMVMELLFLKLR